MAHVPPESGKMLIFFDKFRCSFEFRLIYKVIVFQLERVTIAPVRNHCPVKEDFFLICLTLDDRKENLSNSVVYIYIYK